MKLNKIKMPNTYLIISSIIVFTAILTWFVPGGQYQTVEKDGKTLVLPGTFQTVESNPQNIDDILMAPLNGFVDAALIIGFVFIVGGTFYVLQKTQAIDSGIMALAKAYKSSRIVQYFLIPIFVIVFSLAGAIFGMSEEVIPFVLLFIPLALALGYDTVTGVAIPFIGAGAGFASAFINPFTLGIAQAIAEVQPLSGMTYRLFCWFITTSIAIIFIMRYARKIKITPELSVTYESDLIKKKSYHLTNLNNFSTISKKHKLVLFTFLAGMIVSSYRNILMTLNLDLEFCRFRLILFIGIMIHNIVESSFTHPSNVLWFTFLLVCIRWPSPASLW